ncbi:hypothetical protein C8R43DRAFT_836903, partial [Mycena crocata]
LCPFCDELLPTIPSNELVELRLTMDELSTPNPIPGNSGHRTPSSMSQVQRYCEKHRLERDVLPCAIAGGWPFDPDFSAL